MSVCLSTGGVPICHNALQHYPEFHGADTKGGYPARSSCRVGGYPARSRRGVPCLGGYPAGGVPCWGVPYLGIPPQGTLSRVPPGQGNPPRAGYPPGRVAPLAGHPPSWTWQGTSPSQVRMGGTQLGQQKEYSLYGGRYASCVHAGGLSCLIWINLDMIP